MKKIFFAWAIGIALFMSTAFAATPEITINKELMLTDLSVVNDWRATDPGGPWTFGSLMREIAPYGTDPAEFTESWMNEWNNGLLVNGYTVAPRNLIDVLVAAWPRKDGKLDLDHAPLRLLAIVNRMDQMGTFTPGGAGEGRFVFGFYGIDGDPIQFTVIFEFLLPKDQDSNTVKNWGARWHALGTVPFGAEFNQKLEAITRIFAKRNLLNQVRTNEIALGTHWELREFRLAPEDGLLKLSTTRQNPADLFNIGSPLGLQPLLLDWIRENADAIRRKDYVIPEKFLGGSTAAPTIWAGPLTFEGPEMEETRRIFSSQTCSGCHSGETGTAFLHLSPRAFDQESRLSGFLMNDLNLRAAYLKTIIENGSSKPMNPSRIH